MKQNKPAAKPAAPAANVNLGKLPKTRYEDWADEDQLKEMFKISDCTVDNYRKQGILRCSKWGGRLWFCLPDILRSFEENFS